MSAVCQAVRGLQTTILLGRERRNGWSVCVMLAQSICMRLTTLSVLLYGIEALASCIRSLARSNFVPHRSPLPINLVSTAWTSYFFVSSQSLPMNLP